MKARSSYIDKIKIGLAAINDQAFAMERQKRLTGMKFT